ncbi:MAG: Crp/Fnr family transcriptional regulator [Rhodoferax sp.]|nr:Crp/Fnr family transcriptional regulator [Rhodoferax sp.]
MAGQQAGAAGSHGIQELGPGLGVGVGKAVGNAVHGQGRVVGWESGHATGCGRMRMSTALQQCPNFRPTRIRIDRYTGTAMIATPTVLHATGPTTPVRSDMVSAWLTDLKLDWSPVLGGARHRRLVKDETLFLEGEAADSVFLILEGRVRLTSFGYDGKERHLMILGRNGLVGDCALPASAHYAVSAVAATDAEVAAVPSGRLLGLLAEQPALGAQHRTLAGMRFRILLRHVAVQGANSSRRRVCLHLLDLVNSYGAPHRAGSVITITFTQQEMGSICGLSRVSVSHIFTALEREQVITRAGRLVVIVDRARLEALARS